MEINLRDHAVITTAAEKDIGINFEAPGMAEVVRIAKMQLELERDIASTEMLLIKLKFHLKQVQEGELVDAMRTAGMKTFELISGHKIKVEDFITASLTDGKMPLAVAWCEKHGHSGVIKREVSLEFAKGSDEQVNKAAAVLKKAGFTPVITSEVNTGTFKKLLRECADDPELKKDIPGQELGVYTGTRAVISVPKPKK